MLPMQLLRARTRKGAVMPLFCTSKEELQLAREIIDLHVESAAKKEQKKDLYQRLSTIETQHDDYKLVRGLSALLERRCEFKSTAGSIVDNSSDRRHSVDHDSNSHIPSDAAQIDPTAIRKALFEESSKMGFALTDFERERIIASVASIKNLSSAYVKQVMWSDLEENMVLDGFDPVTEEELVGWYNLSLMQTLLFNCTKLDFSVHGGANWKRVLRNVRRLGLMYNLQQKAVDSQERSTVVTGKSNTGGGENDRDVSHSQIDLVCSIDGPLSVFKLTERYGTSIAKLVPSIVTADRWAISASTIRKTMSGKKIYQFEISSSEIPALLGDPYYSRSTGHGNQNGKPPQSNSQPAISYYDSIVEEKFASKIEQSINGWKLTREPDPIIVSGGRAFIPDFMLERYGRKVYVEIVGFWTKEYLERKMQKISEIVSGKSIDLFVAVNENLACSKITPFSMSSIPRDKIIMYKSDSVPVKVILDYLREIDKEMIERQLSDSSLKIKFEQTKDVISIREIAAKQNIAIESAVKIAERDNSDKYLNAGEYFISRTKAEMLAELLKEALRFSDASQILLKNSIPEACHADLIPKLGYDIVWKDMDSSNAVIARRKEFS